MLVKKLEAKYNSSKFTKADKSAEVAVFTYASRRVRLVKYSIPTKEVYLKDLPQNWDQFEQMHLMQKIGDLWVKECKTAILKVPSSIIHDECNYLLNPDHLDYKKIKLVATKPFLFDDRIKN